VTALTRRKPRSAVAGRRGQRRKPQSPLAVFGRVVTYVILLVGAVAFVGPWAWMVVASFKNIGEIFQYPPSWWTHDPTLNSYRTFLSDSDVPRWFENSALIALSVTALNLIFSSMAAYCFAKRTFPGRGFMFLLGLGTMAIPYAVFLIPNYLVLKHVPLFGGNNYLGNGGHGWLDNYLGLIVPASVSMFNIFLLRQYMRTIPDELLDAAKMDGANHFQIWWRIVLPLTRPALAAVGIFTFTTAWDDFLGPLIVMSSSKHFTVQLGLALFQAKHQTAWNLVFAGSVLATVPVLVVFIIFQKQFIRGIAVTGLK
jgi:multiple sugar transport system permease protein